MKTKRKPTILESIGLATKKMPEINKRVKILGKLSDRYKKAVGSRNKRALRMIANEYQALGCLRLANEIRAEAKQTRAPAHSAGVKKSVDHTAVNVDAGSGPTSPSMAVAP